MVEEGGFRQGGIPKPVSGTGRREQHDPKTELLRRKFHALGEQGVNLRLYFLIAERLLGAGELEVEE